MWFNKQKTAVSRPYFNVPSIVQKKNSLEYKEQKIKFPIVKEAQVKKTIDNRDPVCEELTPLNFNGLKDRVNFRLLKNIGNVIEVTMHCDGNKKETIVGTIQEVGTDFISVLQEQKVIVKILWENIRAIRFKEGEVIVTILRGNIRKIRFKDGKVIVSKRLDAKKMIGIERLDAEEIIVIEKLGTEETIEIEKLDAEETIEIEKLDAEETIEIEKLGTEETIEIEKLGTEEMIEIEKLDAEEMIEIELFDAKEVMP
ncbi:hypothetical protein QUF99_14155 [Bacillus sp. DX4.1]|uniref:hypothetical protein n=1 Tax=Bacillus sp. DX4.1 TaxID=3055867 RepID=UPI0025A2DD07|nr:hypothetical protein [Bacillus sp. DX4.1]MDM5188417.1 hypothetical protein [Bacillus sp. DX4.1]